MLFSPYTFHVMLSVLLQSSQITGPQDWWYGFDNFQSFSRYSNDWWLCSRSRIVFYMNCLVESSEQLHELALLLFPFYRWGNIHRCLIIFLLSYFNKHQSKNLNSHILAMKYLWSNLYFTETHSGHWFWKWGLQVYKTTKTCLRTYL